MSYVLVAFVILTLAFAGPAVVAEVRRRQARARRMRELWSRYERTLHVRGRPLPPTRHERVVVRVDEPWS